MGISIDLSELLREIKKNAIKAAKAKVENEKLTEANIKATKTYKPLKDQNE